MVDFEARRKGLKGLPREKLPPAKPLLLQKGHLVLPLAAIVYFMLAGFTITRSALWGILVWREFAGAPKKSAYLNLAMFVLFVAGLAVLIKAGA